MKTFCLALCVASLLPSAALAEGRYDFDLYDLSDKLVRTSALRRRCKLLVVDFFSLYCKPCRKSLPKLARWQKQYASRGLCVLVVAEPGDVAEKGAALEATKAFFRGEKLALRVAWDKYALVARRFGVSKKDRLDLPQLFLLDAKGAIVKRARDAKVVGKAIDARLR